MNNSLGDLFLLATICGSDTTDVSTLQMILFAGGRHVSEGNAEFHHLMKRLASGDANAAEELIEKYRHDLHRVIRNRLHQKLRRQFDSIDFLQSVWGTFFAIPADRLQFNDSSALRPS